MSSNDERVTTWADGFGVWHATVTLPGDGLGYDDTANAARIRAKARRAIRREILARERGPIGPVRVRVEEYGALTVPDDFPVRPILPGEGTDPVTCGACERTWDDAVPTQSTPAPSARCPFEYFHGYRSITYTEAGR